MAYLGSKIESEELRRATKEGTAFELGNYIDSFEALVTGELDDLPEQAFLNVGGADDAREKAEQLQRQAGA